MNRASQFLAAYRVTGNITTASLAAGISRDLHHRRMRKDDPAYHAAFAAAREEVETRWAADAVARAHELAAKIQELEEAVWDRALNGIEKPVVYQGSFTYAVKRDESGAPICDEEGRPLYEDEPLTVRKFSEGREQFLLRGARPDVYRERHELTGKDGGPVAATLNVTFVSAPKVPEP